MESAGASALFLNPVDETLVGLEEPKLDPNTGVIESRWVFYEKRGKDLIYVAEFSYRIRIYTLYELIEVASEAGWEFLAAYHRPTEGTPYIPCRRPSTSCLGEGVEAKNCSIPCRALTRGCLVDMVLPRA